MWHLLSSLAVVSDMDFTWNVPKAITPIYNMPKTHHEDFHSADFDDLLTFSHVTAIKMIFILIFRNKQSKFMNITGYIQRYRPGSPLDYDS